MFSQALAQPIFPTFVWLHQLEPDLAARLNAKALADLDRLMGPRPPLQPGETWQSDQSLHKKPEFADLLGVFRAAASGVLDSLEIEYQGFAITGCWANMNPPGSPHPSHTHPNNYLSGVYYVHAPPPADSISFHDPRVQREIFAPRIRRFNQFNAPIHNLRTQTGALILFPAWLGHSVVPNESREVRVSIAFNVMFTNFAETISPPIWEGLTLRDDDGGDGGRG